MTPEPEKAGAVTGTNAPDAAVAAAPPASRRRPATAEKPAKNVERLFPFVLRSRILIPGQDRLRYSKSRLHFVLLTHDVSETTRAKILRYFGAYPILQHYTSADLERFFGLHGAKVIGFAKSRLAQSIYAELKGYRLNKPPLARPAADRPPTGQSHGSAPVSPLTASAPA